VKGHALAEEAQPYAKAFLVPLARSLNLRMPDRFKPPMAWPVGGRVSGFVTSRL